ncbi:hypothetical protein DKP78_23990, partial [Enterococcus faecium]
FGIDALQQAREHLFLDLVDRRLEPLDTAVAGLAAGVLAIGQPLHRVDLRLGRGVRDIDGRIVGAQRERIERRELIERRCGR